MRGGRLHTHEKGDVKRLGWERAFRWGLIALASVALLFGATGCATLDPEGLPGITTAELRAKMGNPERLKGIAYNQAVGLAFQKAVLAHLPGGRAERPSRRLWKSDRRFQETGGRFKSVIPDGVAGAVEGFYSPQPPVITTHPESTFIEVKAVKGKIGLSYAQHQIVGMFDALDHSPAASSVGPRRAYPSLYFICTGDTVLGKDIELLGVEKQILVWLSRVVDLENGNLQVTSPICLNCSALLKDKQVPLPFHGTPFPIPTLGGPGMGGIDAPMLDDGLVGHPGAPGNTSPNP